MDVFYKRVTTWQKWPDNDLIETDVIEYSLSKRKWNSFFTTEPLPVMMDRQKLVAAHLKRKVSHITLKSLKK